MLLRILEDMCSTALINRFAFFCLVNHELIILLKLCVTSAFECVKIEKWAEVVEMSNFLTTVIKRRNGE